MAILESAAKSRLPFLIPTLMGWLAQSASGGTFYVDLNCPNPTPPFANWATAATNIQDAVDAAWIGDDIIVTNGTYATGGRVWYGALSNRVLVDLPMTLRSVNGPQSTVIQGGYGMRCVVLVNGAVLSGFTLSYGMTLDTGDVFFDQSGAGLYCESDAAVATNCVIVGNTARRNGGGVYHGTLHDCTIAGNHASFGAGAYGATLFRCNLNTNVTGGGGGGAYGCVLNDCTLTGNSAYNGGGAEFGTLNRCTLTGNRATYGGGASKATLTNCLLIGNSASSLGGGISGCRATNCVMLGNSSSDSGGGADASVLNNCTVAGNSARTGGGAGRVTVLNNCVVYFNSATTGANYDLSAIYDRTNDVFIAIVNYTCIMPQPTNGAGNLTNNPQFVDIAAGNLRLQSNSPCINSGRNGYVSASVDLDRNPRIAGGTVDTGAYEFPSPTSTLSYGWAQRFSLSTDGAADFQDPDGDGFDNWHESKADTDPANALSVLRMVGVTNGTSGLHVTWQSVGSRSYSLDRTARLGEPTAFQTIATGICGVAGLRTFNDTNATGGGPYFYRVSVQ